MHTTPYDYDFAPQRTSYFIACRRHTQRLCTLVSVAFLLSRFEFGFPGNPYMIAKLMELDSEI